MSNLREQAQGIVEVCKTAISARKDMMGVDNQTIEIARAIVAQAKEEFPNDKVLAAVDLSKGIGMWTALQSAMETVIRTVPAKTQKVF